jgi:hypothetical protein
MRSSKSYVYAKPAAARVLPFASYASFVRRSFASYAEVLDGAAASVEVRARRLPTASQV